MADNLNYFNTAKIETKDIGAEVSKMMQLATDSRKQFERTWYDNNFFDDGFHYRYISRQTGRIVDLQDKSSTYNPQRAIPKASLQIRGMVNLLLAGDFVPAVYPQSVSKVQYPTPQEYTQALDESKNVAKRTGHWLTDEWKRKQHMNIKLAFALLLAMKHRVAWIQVWPDAIEEIVKSEVYDAFDIYTLGHVTDPSMSPFMGKVISQTISQIKANENFDKGQLEKISPDNKYASSEIKQAYMQSKFGSGTPSDATATLLLKEFYIKEYLTEENIARIRAQKDGDKILRKHTKKDGTIKKGDVVLRQVFEAGEVWLRDQYISLPDYPFIDVRIEPGPLYGIAPMQRFIPTNKSLDVVVSRVEKYTNTMVTGAFLKRDGEDFEITNQAGGQVISYKSTKPEQLQINPIPQFVFEYIQLLNTFIEEQGVSTTALGKVPRGVKANAAIESLKASEFSNLKVPLDMVKDSVRKWCEKMLDYADDYFVSPQSVYRLDKGEPDYFDIISKSALESREQLKVETPNDVIPVSRDYLVEIDVQAGLGFTPEGKRAAIKDIVDTMLTGLQAQAVTPEAFKQVIQQYLETYNFGPVQDVIEAMEQPTQPMTEEQIAQIKIALLEVMKDLGADFGGNQDQRIMETKVGAVEALKDTGMIDATNKPQEKPISESINYKDAPEDIKRQMEAQAGFTPSKGISPAGTDQMTKIHSATKPMSKEIKK
jgi:hypothetical protein